MTTRDLLTVADGLISQGKREDALLKAAQRSLRAAFRRDIAGNREAAIRLVDRSRQLDRSAARHMVLAGAMSMEEVRACFPRPN